MQTQLHIRSSTLTGMDPLAQTVGVRVPDADTWDTADAENTLLLSDLYTVDSGTSSRLLATLPPLAVIEANVGACPVSRTTFAEITREEPGQQIPLDRTLDLMLITALRAWFTRPGAQVPAWTGPMVTPSSAPPCACCKPTPHPHGHLRTLAARAGVSRANLARRFTALVGLPPMTFLRERRLTLAADLLREPDATLATVADRVGFANAFALSTAFKRQHGISPSEHRTRETQAEIGPSTRDHTLLIISLVAACARATGRRLGRRAVAVPRRAPELLPRTIGLPRSRNGALMSKGSRGEK